MMGIQRRSTDKSDGASRGSGKFLEGVEGIEVRLTNWTDLPYKSITQMIAATERWPDADEENPELVEEQLGGGLSVPLESVVFTFGVKGVSRACTHQLVRTRIGAGFSQQSLRWCDFRDFDVRVPETFKEHPELEAAYLNLVERSREFYALGHALDVPYQDIRFGCPIGTVTHIYPTYNFLALRNLCATRLCEMMQWEINHVTKLMKAEVTKVYPMLGEALKPRCETIGKCTFQGWEKPDCSNPMVDKKDWTSQHFGQK
jgi:thymidylate synthase (FAD)